MSFLENPRQLGLSARLPKKGISAGDAFEAFDELAAVDETGLAHLHAAEGGHQLVGAAAPDAKETFDSLSLEVRQVRGFPQSFENFGNAAEPGRFGGHSALAVY